MPVSVPTNEDLFQSVTTLELRTPRECEQGPEAMAQILSSLPNPPHEWWKFFHQAPEFHLEILNQGQTLYFLLTTPTVLSEYVASQLIAAYPEVLIRPLAHNPLQDFYHPLPKAVGQLRLARPSQFPLKTFRESGELDLFSAVLSSMAKLQEGDEAVIQLVIRKSRDHWKHGSASLAPESSQALEQLSAQLNNKVVSRKMADMGFETVVRLLVMSHSQSRADQILHTLASSFTALQSEFNSLTLAKPLFFKERATRHLIERAGFSNLHKQFFSPDELATIFHLPNKVLSNIKNIAWGKNLLGEPPENLPTYTLTPEAELADINLTFRAEFKNQEQIFGLKKVDRRRHMYVIGKSGTGKSTLLANMIINDLKHDEGLAVVDPHGDLIETILDYIPKHRINDVVVFDPADTHSVVKLNLFEGGSVVHRELIASGIVAMFQKMYANSWGPRLEYILRNSLLTLLSTNAKLEDILRILTDEKFRAQMVEKTPDQVLKNFWTMEFNMMENRLRSESISPILNKVGQFVTSPLIRNVVNTTTSSFDIEKVMNEGKILLVNASQGKLGEDNAALLGSMVITKIQLAAMNRVYTNEADRRDFFLYIDEFQNFATTSFIKILSEARKYRLNLTLANQYMGQISDDVKAAIFGNAGTMASFILGAQDASWMMQEFGDRYTQEDLVSLARYQVILKLMIDGQVSRPFPALTLPLASSRNQNREKVLRVSREQFGRKRE